MTEPAVENNSHKSRHRNILPNDIQQNGSQ